MLNSLHVIVFLLAVRRRIVQLVLWSRPHLYDNVGVRVREVQLGFKAKLYWIKQCQALTSLTLVVQLANRYVRAAQRDKVSQLLLI